MDTHPIFLEKLIIECYNIAKLICSILDHHLDGVNIEKLVNISREEIAKAIPPDFLDEFIQETPKKICGTKFTSDYLNNKYYSEWLTSSILYAENKYSCQVGIRIDGIYTRIMGTPKIFKTEIRIVSAGKDPVAACKYILKRQSSFKTDLFDEDGYIKNHKMGV